MDDGGWCVVGVIAVLLIAYPAMPWYQRRYRDPFTQFNDQAKNSIQLAKEESRRQGHNFIGTETILLGLIREDTGIAAKALKSCGVSLEAARDEVERIVGFGSGFVEVQTITPRGKRVIEFARVEARKLGHKYIGVEHLLLGLLQETGSVAKRLLDEPHND